MALIRFFVVFLLGIGAAAGAYFTGAVDYLSQASLLHGIGAPFHGIGVPAQDIVLRVRGDASAAACPARYSIENRSGRRLRLVFSSDGENGNTSPVGYYGGYDDNREGPGYGEDPAGSRNYEDSRNNEGNYEDARQFQAPRDYQDQAPHDYEDRSPGDSRDYPSAEDRSSGDPRDYPSDPRDDPSMQAYNDEYPRMPSDRPFRPSDNFVPGLQSIAQPADSVIAVEPGQQRMVSLAGSWRSSGRASNGGGDEAMRIAQRCGESAPVVLQLTDCATDVGGVCGNARPGILNANTANPGGNQSTIIQDANSAAGGQFGNQQR